MTQPDDGVDDTALHEMEDTAVELAALAGAAIVEALGRTLAVRYKSQAGQELEPTDPVSDVDRAVEAMIRERLAKRFDGHDVIGEEFPDRPGRGHPIAWAVDPVDGTANFVNGFPLFSASIGVLHRGRPVVGAVWCSTGHALRPGVYHARAGGPLCIDGVPLVVRRNLCLRRHLGGEPATSADRPVPWDVRVTGSAAIKCAFVAMGLLRVARFARPNVWDVAGGLALVRAGGGVIHQRRNDRWEPVERLEERAGGDLADWREALVVGEAEAVAILCRVTD